LKRLIHVYLDENIGSANNYRQLTVMLEILTPSDTVVFKINSYGGNAYTMIQIYNSIKKTKAHTVADVTMAMSAGAIIALACDEILVTPFSTFMIHSIQTRVGGKISDVKNTVEYDVKFNNQIIRKVFKGFLSGREINQVINGTEIWLCCDELKAHVLAWYKYKNETK
jgi:ATP-dependent protease ClpP protease subunit